MSQYFEFKNEYQYSENETYNFETENFADLCGQIETSTLGDATEELYDPCSEITYRSISLDAAVPIAVETFTIRNHEVKPPVVENQNRKQIGQMLEKNLKRPPSIPFCYILEPTKFSIEMDINDILEKLTYILTQCKVNQDFDDMNFIFHCNQGKNLEFKLSFFSKDQEGNSFLLEAQRRKGCTVSFSKLFHRIRSALIYSNYTPQQSQMPCVLVDDPPSRDEYVSEVGFLVDSLSYQKSKQETLECLLAVILLLPSNLAGDILQRSVCDNRERLILLSQCFSEGNGTSCILQKELWRYGVTVSC